MLSVIFPQITHTVSATPSLLISHLLYENDAVRHCISSASYINIRSVMTNPLHCLPHFTMYV